jgi:hypothetical protein
MSPVVESLRGKMTPECRSKTVISSPIKTACGSIRDFPTAEGAAENADSFMQKNKQIRVRPIYISDVPRPQSPPNILLHRPKTEYNRPARFSEGESIFVNKSIPLPMSLKNNDKRRCLRLPPPLNIEEHFSGEYVTVPRLPEGDIFTKEGGSLVTTGFCLITEQGLTTSTLSPTKVNEENARNSPTKASSLNGESSYTKGDEREQNTFYCTKEDKPRKTVLTAIDDVRDSLQAYPTFNTTDDDGSSRNGVDYTQKVFRSMKTHGMRPTDIERDNLRHASTAVAYMGTERSVLTEGTHSKRFSERRDEEDTFIAKYQEIDDKHDLCEHSTSSVIHSSVRNHTQIRSKQSLKETISSDQNCIPNEYNTRMDEGQPIEDRGESPHKSSHMEYKNEDKRRFVDKRVLPHTSSPVKNKPIVNEEIFEYRSDYPWKCPPIQTGDHHRLKDPGDFLQNTPPMGTYIQNEDKRGSEDDNKYSRRRIPSSETTREICDRQYIGNEVVRSEQSSPLGNQTQTADQRFPQSHGASPQSSSSLNELTPTDEDQNIPFQRSTVLVQSRPCGGESVLQQMDAASEPKVHGPWLFSVEDTALRSRVLVLLWVLLGERRLREVGYPVEPVHRILWRAVDVCCSVAGVKSAAAVPLNADHDCGMDMMCFRDHAHRFLEVCAPTREHWKQFGWASLTVDAVVRKIYDEGK